MEHPTIVNPQLDGDSFYWEKSEVGILFNHGFTASTAEVRLLAQNLFAAGYTISAPLLPGHNTHPSELNRVHWKDWTCVIENSYKHIKNNCKRVIVGGESTGGLLSLYLASEHPEIVAILLYAPALRLTLRPLDVILLYILSPFVGSIPKKSEKDDLAWRGYSVNPLKGTIQLLQLQKVIFPRLKSIHQPALIIQGRKDTVVHPGVPDTIYHQIGASRKEKYWMNNSSHCVILDKELNEVTKITLEFINKTLQNLPSLI